MKVVILCGGFGTRLSEETESRPKPMVEIGGRPILWHIMKLYSHFGYSDFILCLGYKGDVIRRYFLDYLATHHNIRLRLRDHSIEYLEVPGDELNWSITLIETGNATPTGGRIARVAEYIVGERFMVTYGDGVADVDVKALVDFHTSSSRVGTVTGVRPAARFGHLRLDGDVVANFREKAQVDEGWINGGFFVFERSFLDQLSDDVTLEGKPLEALASRGQLGVYRHEGYWRPMDTLRDKRILEEEWSEGHPAWKVWS